MPSCAITASRAVCVFASAASVATTTSVVLAPSVLLSSSASGRGVGARDGETAPNSPACSNGQAQNTGLPGRVTAPSELTAASAPTVPVRRDERRAAEAALERAGGGAEAGAGVAERELGRGGGAGAAAELAIGRQLAPGLVAAVVQVEQDRRRHDRDAGIGRAKPLPCAASQAMAPPAASRPKAEPPLSTTACTALDQPGRAERVGLARARRAAAHVDRADRGRLRPDHGDPAARR